MDPVGSAMSMETGRSSIAAPAQAARVSHARKSSKSWLQDAERLSAATREDAQQANVDPNQAIKIVSCVTRFATVMCVIIAIVKVGVYNITGAAVVKTSALDSIGDLVANMISLYTGMRMANVDLIKYPIGQSKFEPLGVLVFSTLMASMMFSNSMENLTDLFGHDETSREDAISNFWKGLFGVHKEGEGDVHSWSNMTGGFDSFCSQVKLPDKGDQPLILQALLAGSYDKATEVVEATRNWAGEVENPELEGRKILKQNLFLGCCACYKLCLFLYVQFVAIPATGSSVLQALANDKRNDFIATSFAITMTTLCYLLRDDLDAIHDGLSGSMDNVISLILSLFIMKIWINGISEQLNFLSCPSVEPDILEGLNKDSREVVRATDTASEAKAIAYYSSGRYTVEVELAVIDPEKPFKDVAKCLGDLDTKLSNDEDVERVIVRPKLMELS